MYDAGYLDIAPAMERIPVGIAELGAMLFTLGLSPGVETYNYAVCVDVSGADGARRAGFSQGRIRTVVNMWGSDQQLGESEKLRDQILDQLAIEAWHMAWAAHPSGAGGTPDCEVAMKEFIQPCEIYCR